MAVAMLWPVFEYSMLKPYEYVIQSNSQTFVSTKCLRVNRAGPEISMTGPVAALTMAAIQIVYMHNYLVCGGRAYMLYVAFKVAF